LARIKANRYCIALVALELSAMSHNIMKNIQAILIVFFSIVRVGFCDYFNDISCSDNLSDYDDFTYVYLADDFHTEFYTKVDAKIKFGDHMFNKVLYIFKDKKFYGKQIPVCSNQEFHDLLRYFQKTYGDISYSKKHSYGWMLDDKWIFIKRFSYHLGEVNIVCRKQFEKILGINLKTGVENLKDN